MNDCHQFQRETGVNNRACSPAELCCARERAFFIGCIDRASRTNVRYVAQPGGSMRDDSVTEAAKMYGMTMIHTGVRCFLH